MNSILKRLSYFRLKDQIRQIKQNPNQIQDRIAIFIDEYNRQLEVIANKLKTCTDFEKKKHIQEYKEDLDRAVNIVNCFITEINETPQSQYPLGLKERLLKNKAGRFILIMKELNKLNNKYKKENCDIDNFEC